MKRLFCFLFLFCLTVSAFAQSHTVKFAERDTCSLYMDIYEPQGGSPDSTCVIFVFGGGFLRGERNMAEYVKYARELNRQGYTVACIDYRLGLKGVDTRGVRIVKALDHAINLAVEDLYAATAYLLEHSEQYRIDPKRIVLSGTSAGAITVLQADYELCNRSAIAKVLPADFHYAGVIAFSGAIYSHNGKVKYAEKPSPTLFFHGIEDSMVPYKAIRIGKIGFFGTDPIVKQFEKFNYPYYVRRYEGLAHEVAALILYEAEVCTWFIRQYVTEGRFLQMDATINDGALEKQAWGQVKAGAVYNKRNK